MKEHFPEEPKCKGKWVPIYIEPVINSGERLTIAIVAITFKDYRIYPTLSNPELLKAMYGVHGDDLLSQIDWVLESYEKHVIVKGVLDSWEPPLSGIFMGNISSARSKDIDGIVRQGVSMCSSLAYDNLFDDEPLKYFNKI